MHNWLHVISDVLINRRGGVPTRPGWCTYLVTYRCNARCGMCDSWRIKPGTELTPEQVRSVFRKIGRLDVVRLTGGEPFVRDDFSEIVDAVEEASRPGVLHITSNGSLPSRVAALAESFRAPHKLRFMISVDGLAEEHDTSRGKDVTFALVEETVHRLVELRARLRCQVSMNHTVISPQSLEDHAGLVERFAPLGVDVQAVLAYSDSAMYGLKRQNSRAEDLIPDSGYPLNPALAEVDCTGFVERLLRNTQQLRDPIVRFGKRYYLRGLLARLRGERAPRPSPRCVALRSHIRLLPDGSVPVCQFNSERVGNLSRQSFEELWKAPETTHAREWVDRCTGCWAECEVMPSALYTGDLVLHALSPAPVKSSHAPLVETAVSD